ncbi:hypothetical protein QN372_04585 [Undibacterium sp. RTI2.1]|uniref:hypothetical protein n=1 Tax=unclassified Undibacterium TaxID=2630295 RepID=UPI002AB3A02C|nr:MULTISPECIES: hypothetical protein [unclassified Undibacterium]MDY7538457.1 hypothetical protein [Undibacterium sp. 5I1]MEB0030016.1 hypothetical protein [Undibacterium sp. RTI2.1]MEB0114919.1 hypothetical protein [Undibacterium sp. RTI2.2]MEB0230641.1 hypothetical protein [Undibacterium sp. 10I3]MEB0255878.1 hypothetical protein [Undibacterium sp. 5I1]
MSKESSVSGILKSLRDQALSSKCRLLDRQPQLDRPILTIFECFFCLPSKSYFLDLPLKNICALSHHNFFETGQTWREILYPTREKSGLTCQGWSSGVFNYFDGEWRDNLFSQYAENCMGGARFTAIGGAVVVTNGMHRVAGGYVYRAAQQGENAVFSKVRIRHCELMPEVKKFLENLDSSLGIFISKSEIACPRFWITDYIQITARGLVTLRRLSPFNGLFGKKKMQQLSPDLLSCILNDTFLNATESAPPYDE